MIPALVSLKNLIKTKYYHIDYPVFRLHYQATVCVLLAFCLILTGKILFGDTIDCNGRAPGRNDFNDNMCYSKGTYTRYAVDINAINQAVEAANRTNSSDVLKLNNITNLSKRAEERKGEMAKALRNQVMPGEPSLMSRGANWLLERLFNDYDDYYVQLANGSRTNLRLNDNDTSIPIELLTERGVSHFLKIHFRSIHRIVKEHNINYQNDVRYIYSGILIPPPVSDNYVVVYWHRYYQYISLILFLQAMLFYLPHYLWKIWENGVVSSICSRLYDNRLAPTEYIESNYQLIEFLQSSLKLNKSLVYKYYLCHFLLIINLITQIIILDEVFNNQFVTYGIDVLTYYFVDYDIYGLKAWDGIHEDVNNPMDFVFPKVTGCYYRTLSEAGKTTDDYNYLCALPLNTLYDKFFLALWFWFVILAIITLIQILFDSLYIAVPRLRKYLFNRRFGPYLSDDSQHSCSLPELFLLGLIGNNTDKYAFAALLRKLNKEDCRSSQETHSLV